MLITKKSSEPMVEVYKEAPDVGAPFVVSDKKNPIPFYKNDSVMNSVVGEYTQGPENSYAKELMKKYPLSNE